MATAVAMRQQVRRERLRAQGLRPVQMWTWDTKAPGFEEAIASECRALRNTPGEVEALAFAELAAGTIEDWR